MFRKTAALFRPFYIVRDVLDNKRKMKSVTMLPSAAVWEIRERIVGFCKILQSPDNDFLSDLTISTILVGRMLWRLSAFEMQITFAIFASAENMAVSCRR